MASRTYCAGKYAIKSSSQQVSKSQRLSLCNSMRKRSQVTGPSPPRAGRRTRGRARGRQGHTRRRGAPDVSFPSVPLHASSWSTPHQVSSSIRHVAVAYVVPFAGGTVRSQILHLDKREAQGSSENKVNAVSTASWPYTVCIRTQLRPQAFLTARALRVERQIHHLLLDITLTSVVRAFFHAHPNNSGSLYGSKHIQIAQDTLM